MGEGEGHIACKPLRGQEMIFREDEWALRKIDGGYDSLWQSLLGFGVHF